ncbi:hypothetical protein Tco_0859329, partial [Tanacetum coccineum]
SSIKKTSVVHEKIMTPRSGLKWKPTGKVFKTVGLRWVPTGKTFTSSTTKVDSEPQNGSNEDIANQYECEQTLDVSAGTLHLSADYIRHWAIHYGLMSYSNVPLIVDVVMICYTIRSAASGLVLLCTLVVSFPAGYMVFLLFTICDGSSNGFYWLCYIPTGRLCWLKKVQISDSFATTQQQSVTALVIDLRQKYGH